MALLDKLVFIKKTNSFTEELKKQYKDSIVFVEESKTIWTHEKEFGLDQEQFNSLKSSVESLKTDYSFKSISDGKNSYSAQNGSQTIKFTGDDNNLITVTVSEEGVKVSATPITATGDDYITASAENNNLTISAKVKKLTGEEGGESSGLADADDVKSYVDSKVQDATDTRVDTIITAVGLGEDGDYQTQSGTNYLGEATSISDETKKLDAKIKEVSDKVNSTDDDLIEEIAKLSDSKSIKEESDAYEVDVTLSVEGGTSGSPAKIVLKNGEDEEITSVDISEIIGKGTIKSSSYDKETGKLTLTFNSAIGTDLSHEIDLGDLLDIGDIIIGDESKEYLEAKTNTNGEGDSGQFEISVKLGNIESGTGGLAKASEVKTYLEGKIQGLKKEESTVSGTNVSVKYKEESGVVTISEVTEKYATISKNSGTGDDPSKIVVSEEDGLVKGSDIKLLAEYVDSKFGDSSAIDALDADVTSGDETNVKVRVVEVDGKITSVNVTETYATESEGTISGDGLVKGSQVQSAIEALSSTSEVHDSKSYVTVKNEIESGKLKSGDGTSVSVTYGNYDSTSGIATTEDTKTYIDGLLSWVEID